MPPSAELVQSAARAAAIHAPRRALCLPQRGEENVGIARIECDVDAAGLRVLVQDLLPGLAAVARAEDAALFVVAKRMSQRRDEGDVRIFRIDDQAADGVRVRQADELPGLAGVDGLVHAIAADDVAADARFAGADVDDVGIGLGNRDARRSTATRLSSCRTAASSSGRRPWSSTRRRRPRRSNTCHVCPTTPDTATTRPPRYGPTRRYCSAFPRTFRFAVFLLSSRANGRGCLLLRRRLLGRRGRIGFFLLSESRSDYRRKEKDQGDCTQSLHLQGLTSGEES